MIGPLIIINKMLYVYLLSSLCYINLCSILIVSMT